MFLDLGVFLNECGASFLIDDSNRIKLVTDKNGEGDRKVGIALVSQKIDVLVPKGALTLLWV